MGQLKSLSTSLQEKEEDAAQGETQEKDDSKEEVELLKAQVELMKERLGSLEEEKASLESSLSIQKQNYRKIELDLEKSLHDKALVDDELCKLKSTVDELTDNEDLILQAKKDLETKVSELKIENENLLSNIEQLRNDVKLNSDLLQVANETIEKERERNVSLQTELELKGASHDTSFDVDSDFKDFCDKLEAEKKQLQSEIVGLKKQLTGSNNMENKHLHGTVDSRPSEMSESETAAVSETFVKQKSDDLDSAPIDMKSLASVDRQELVQKLKSVTEERNKFKQDNKKLLKLSKGKDAKLRIMSENFEELRQERDSLLAERDSLDTKCQDLSSTFMSDYGAVTSVELQVKSAELQAMLNQKEEEIKHLTEALENSRHFKMPEKNTIDVSMLSKENEKLKTEAAKLQMIDKGKSAKIKQINDSFEHQLQEKSLEIQQKMEQITTVEQLLLEEKDIVAALQREKDKMVAEQTKLQKLNRGKEAKLKKMEECVSEKEQEIAEKNLENKSLQEKIADLNTVIESLNEREKELQKEIENAKDNIRNWEERYQELETKVKELENTVESKVSDISNMSGNEELVKKLKEEKIILEFELDCAKEELEKVKGSIDEESSKLKDLSGDIDTVVEERESKVEQVTVMERTLSDSGEEVAVNNVDCDPVTHMSSDEMKKKLANLHHENKELVKEKSKLQKIAKGKDAKVKKMEEFVKEQQNMISEKETDVLIMKEKIEELTSKLEDLEDIEQDMRFKLDNAIADVDEWRDHSHDLEDQLDAAHEALDRKTEEIYRLEDDLVASRDEMENLCIERDEMERQRDRLQEELSSVKSKLTQKVDEVEELTNHLQELQAQKDHFEAEIKKLQKVNKGKETKIKKLEESFDSHESSIEQSKAFVSNLRAEIESLNLALNESQTSVNGVSSRLIEEESLNQHLKQEIKALRERLEIASSDLNSKEQAMLAEISSLRDERDDLLVLRTNVEMMSSDKDGTIRLKEDQINELTEQIEELKANYEKQNAEAEDAMKQMTDIAQAWETRCRSVEETLSGIQTEVEEKGKMIADLEKAGEDMQQQLSHAHGQCEQWKSDFERLQHEKDMLSEQANNEMKNLREENQEVVKSLQSKMSALTKQFQETLNQLEDKDAEIASFRKNIRELKETLDVHKNNEQKLENELETLKQAFKDTQSEQEIKENYMKQVVKLKDMLDEKERELETLITENEKLTQSCKMLQELETELADTKSNLDQVQAEKASVQQELVWYYQYYNETQPKLAELETSLETYQNEMQNLNALKGASEETCQKLQEENEKFKLELSEKDEKYQVLENELTKERQMVSEKEDALSRLLSENETLQNTAAFSNSSIEEMTLKMNQQKYKSEDMVLKTSTLESQLTEALNEAAKNKLQFEVYEQSLLEKDSIVSDLNFQLKTMKNDNEEMQKHLVQQKSEIDHLKHVVQKLDNQCQIQNENFVQLETKKRKIEQEVEEMKFQLDNERKQYTNQLNLKQEKLDDADRSLLQHQTRANDLQREILMMKDEQERNKAPIQEAEFVQHEVAKVAMSAQGHASRGIGESDGHVNVLDLESQILPDTVSVSEHTASACSMTADNTELKKIKKLCKGKDARIRKLEEKIKQMESGGLPSDTSTTAHIENYISENEQLKETIKQLQNDLAKLNSDVSESHDFEDSTRLHIQEISENYHVLQTEMEQKSQENAELLNTLQQWQTSYYSLQEMAKETEENMRLSLVTLQNEVIQEKNGFAELNNKYEMLLHQSRESEQLQTSRGEELQNLKKMLKDLLVELEDLRKMNTVLQQSGEGAESEKQRFEELLKNEREEIQSLYEQMNQLVSEKLDLEMKVEQKDRDLRKAADELRKFAVDRDRLDDLIEQCESLESEKINWERDVAELRKRLNERDHVIKQMEDVVKMKNNEFESLRDELGLNVNRVEEMEQAVDIYKTQVTESTERIEVLEKELLTKKEAASKLQGMCEEKDQLVASLKESVTTSEDEASKLRKKCAALSEEIQLYKQQLSEQTEEEEKHIQMKLEQVQAECEQLRHLNETQQSYANDVAAKLDEAERKIKTLEQLKNDHGDETPGIPDRSAAESNQVYPYTVSVLTMLCNNLVYASAVLCVM